MTEHELKRLELRHKEGAVYPNTLDGALTSLSAARADVRSLVTAYRTLKMRADSDYAAYLSCEKELVALKKGQDPTPHGLAKVKR